jgi:hypothetical protein
MPSVSLNKLASLQIDGFEQRTHFGKLGRKLKIVTNFFEITELPNICIYQYVPSPPSVPSLIVPLISCIDLMSTSRQMCPLFSTGALFLTPYPLSRLLCCGMNISLLVVCQIARDGANQDHSSCIWRNLLWLFVHLTNLLGAFGLNSRKRTSKVTALSSMAVAWLSLCSMLA